MASAASFLGMITGLMLLGLAGWIVITMPSSIVENDAPAMERKLQTPFLSPTQPPANKNLVSFSIYNGTVALQAILWVLFAVLFKSRVVDPVVDKRGKLSDQSKPSQQDDFNNNICECFEDKWVCLQGLCCPIARMAATNEISGIFGYWQTVGLYCITGLFCNSCLVPCCLTVYFRHHLKNVMNIKDNILNDFIIACCIPSLAICQQGNGVDYASGFELTGCCKYDWLDGSQASSE